MDDSLKLYCFSLLFFESELYNKNFPDARERLIKILINLGINFEQKYYFSNGYRILKIKKSIEDYDYTTPHPFLNERWIYWFQRWNNYNKKIFYQNILNCLIEIKDSVPNLEKYRIYKDLVYINLELLTKNFKKLIIFPDLITEKKKKELKKAIKCLNEIRNNIHRNKVILSKLVSYLEDFFEKEFPLEHLINLLYKELDKNIDSSLKQLDFLSDLIYFKLKHKNMDIPSSIFKLISNEGDKLKNLNDIKQYLKDKLIETLNPKKNKYTIFYPIRDLEIVSKIPPFQQLHFFNRKIDGLYDKELGTEFLSLNNWVRINVEAYGIGHALYLSENIFNRYRNFGIIKDLHFKLILKNNIVFKNDSRVKTSHSIEDKRLYRIKVLDQTKSEELRGFLNVLENNLEKIELQKINAITELIKKVENTFDFTDQLTFLWIIIETLDESYSYMEDFARILTIIDEIQIIQDFYVAFHSRVQNDWDNFKDNYLSKTKLKNFPKEFKPNEFIDSLEHLYDALENNYIKQKMKIFSEKTSLSQYQRVKLKTKLNLKLILNIYKYRNQYFHSGFYDLVELRKLIPTIYQKLLIIIEAYVSYLLANKNKNFQDFKCNWINSFESFLNRLNNKEKYSNVFGDLLSLIEVA